jgi:hypothetical protein
LGWLWYGKKKKSKRTSVMQSKCKNKNSNISTNHLADAPPKEGCEKNVWQTLAEQAWKSATLTLKKETPGREINFQGYEK